MEPKNVHELKAMAKARGFARERYSKLRKPKLIQLLAEEKQDKPKSNYEKEKNYLPHLFDKLLKTRAEIQRHKAGRAFTNVTGRETYNVPV